MQRVEELLPLAEVRTRSNTVPVYTLPTKQPASAPNATERFLHWSLKGTKRFGLPRLVPNTEYAKNFISSLLCCSNSLQNTSIMERVLLIPMCLFRNATARRIAVFARFT